MKINSCYDKSGKEFLRGLKSQHSRAFTLIELMVVMAIIVAIALMAIGGYAGVQKQARLDFAADALVSLIKERIQLARSGQRLAVSTNPGINTNADFALQCFALRSNLSAISPNLSALSFAQSDYVAVGTDVDGSSGKVDFCQTVKDEGWKKVDFLDENLTLKKVSKVSSLGGSSLPLSEDELELYFKPPFAKVFKKVGDNFVPLQGEVYLFEIGYKDSVNSSEQRTVEYNPQTGEISKR